MARSVKITRNTSETQITLFLALDTQTEKSTINTGHGFIDHMLEQVVKHGQLQLDLEAKGDLHVDVHHLAEDLGIVLGQSFDKVLADRRGIERYAHSFVPMDESLAHVVLDFSGRPFLAFEPSGFEGHANGFNMHHLREFLRGFCNHAHVTMHVRVLSGKETHHVCEAIIKAFARALQIATKRTGQGLPSTKGVI